MKFDTFITLCINKMKNGGLQEFIDEHVKNKYVPLEEKIARVDVIIKNTFYEKNDNDEQVLHINSVANHMFTNLTLVDLYTDIEIDFKKSLDQYNKLKESGILDMILMNIDKQEIEEFLMVHKYMQNDIMENEYNIHSFIKQQVERFGKLIGFTLEPFIDKLNTDEILKVLQEAKK